MEIPIHHDNFPTVYDFHKRKVSSQGAANNDQVSRQQRNFDTKIPILNEHFPTVYDCFIEENSNV